MQQKNQKPINVTVQINVVNFPTKTYSANGVLVTRNPSNIELGVRFPLGAIISIILRKQINILCNF